MIEWGRRPDLAEVTNLGKKLSEMSLEELWDLFPIFLVAHSDKWQLHYREIEALLKRGLSKCPVTRISHIGSTAVPGIWAKDIVDVLIEVSQDAEIAQTAAVLEACGFFRMSAEAGRISFNRGYTDAGFADKVFHIHLRYAGDHDELYFRDYLIAHPQTAKEYEALKLELWRQFAHNRDAYTSGKSGFVQNWTKKAKEIYAGRY